MRRFIRNHWEGSIMALLMAVAFCMAGTPDEPTTIAKDSGTAVAAKE